MIDPERKVFPVQARARSHPTLRGFVNRHVYLAAYEVYAAIHGEQDALVTGGCLGGFGPDELIALLYARSFPRSEWRERANEALSNMDLA